MEPGDIIKAHCNTCGGSRNHFVIHVLAESWREDLGNEAEMSGKDQYELLKCAGCNAVRLRHTSWFSEQVDDDGRPVPVVTYYPPASIRPKPTWLTGIELSSGKDVHIVWMAEFVTRLLEEVYIALHNDCRSLAAMGIRALLEKLMIEHVQDRGSFAKNLNAFEQEGYIGKKQREIIEATLEVGHASIHRDYKPSRQDVMQVLDIAENIVQLIYVSGEQAKALKKRIPPRTNPK